MKTKRTAWIKHTEVHFAAVGALFGLLYIVVVPPFQVADEDRHYFRAFQIAEGHFVSEVHEEAAGGWLPVSVAACGSSTNAMRWDLDVKTQRQDIVKRLRDPLNASERVFVGFRSASYSPIAYLPAAAAMRIGIGLKASPLLLMYAGRLANLIVWLLLIFLAIRIVPLYKWVFFVLALTPMSLYQGASVSADSVTNAMAFLTLAVVVRQGCSETGPIHRKTIVLLVAMTTLLTMTKNILFLFCFLYFLIPVDRCGTRKRYFLLFLLLASINLSALLIWHWLVGKLPIYWNVGVFPEQQAAYILRHPFLYLCTLFDTVRHYFYSYYSGFIGAFGWRFFYLSKWHVRLWILLLIFVSLTEGRSDLCISRRQKGILFSVCALTGVMIFTLLYLFWNPIGAERIQGVQSRYFIPIAPLFFLCLYNRRFGVDAPIKPAMISLATAVSLLIALSVISQRFYETG